MEEKKKHYSGKDKNNKFRNEILGLIYYILCSGV